jgi:hypothetical protein
MTKKNPLRKYHLGVLRRRYGDLDDWTLICSAAAEVFAGQDIADVRAEYGQRSEWGLIVGGVYIACAMQLDGEGK